MLASSVNKMAMPIGVDVVEAVTNHKVVESDLLPANSLAHRVHPSSGNRMARPGHHHYKSGAGGRKNKSPDLIELSDAAQSPISGLEDDSSPGVTTDADSEEPYCDTESPTPTNSAVNVDPKNYWQGAEEHRELLATEGEEEEEEDGDDDDDDVPDEDKGEIELVEIDSSDSSDLGTSNNPSSESDAGNLSCDDDVDDEEVWKISPDQLSYYKAQFKTLQPDPNGLVGGGQARPFFEKSRLPTAELSHIWQLSDVTKDGALSLKEFCTAMHLVVLRRNRIALPRNLPPLLLEALQPTSDAATAPPLSAVSVPVDAKPLATAVAATVPVPVPLPTHAPPTAPTATAADGVGTSHHWTKFVDSPTGSVASPGPHPVNFDFKRVTLEQDPRILHPVALRLTPESQLQQHQHHSATDVTGVSSGAVSLPPAATGNALGSSSTAPGATSTMGKKEPPPPPPPRPYRGHARSSSLDLNQLGRSSGLNSAAGVAPPAVPPRVSPSMGSPRKENEMANHGSSGGAFQVYRRPIAPSGFERKIPPATTSSSSSTSTTAKGLTSVIEDHQRRGDVLRKQQQLLTKQLLEIQDERNNLELRLQKTHLNHS